MPKVRNLLRMVGSFVHTFVFRERELQGKLPSNVLLQNLDPCQSSEFHVSTKDVQPKRECRRHNPARLTRHKDLDILKLLA